jgi:hypothetical protein
MVARHWLSALALLVGSAAVAHAQQLDHTLCRLPAPAGFVVTPELTGLVVGLPGTTELVYFNTLTEQETKRVALDFKPGAMCLQGKTLYVAAQGAALVNALDLSTGKQIKEYGISGDAIAKLACHPQAGPIFASTASRQIHSVDPATGKVTKTEGVGVDIGMTPDGKTLISGFQPSDREFDYAVKNTLDGHITIPWDGTWGARAQLLKYKIAGNELKFEAAQNNAASNGWAFHLSPDGTRVMIPGGGGWRPPEGNQGGGYVTAVFSTSNLQTMVGQGPHCDNIIFHPILPLGVASHGGRELSVFHSKSFKPRGKIIVSAGADKRPFLLAFGGKGTTVILWNGENPQNQVEGLHFLPLDLSSEERAELAKAYGPLPMPVVVAAALPEVPIKPEPAKLEPPRPTKPAVAKVHRPPTTPARPTKPAAEVARNDAPRVSRSPKPSEPVEATAGFNDAKGINADAQRQSPYPLGVPGVPGGLGEPGWADPWVIGFDKPEKLSFVKDVVQEGDGAAFLVGTAHMKRRLAVPIKEFVEVEAHIRVPENGHCYIYIAEGDGATGPMLGVVDGKFQAIDGTGQEYGNHPWRDVVTAWDPQRWYKVVATADVKRREYDVYVDDRKFDHQPLHFRHDVSAIGQIGLLVEKAGGAYFDNLRVTPLKESPFAKPHD